MKKHLLAVVLQLAASGADAYYTDRALHRPGWREHNPVTRTLVHDRGTLAAYFSVTAAGHVALPYWLRRRGHGKLAGWAGVEGIADNAEGAAYTATHAK